MTESTKRSIRLSEIRERINAILGMADADRTDAIKTELATLTTEGQTLEPEYRAALVAESADRARAEAEAAAVGSLAVDPETRERRELRGRSTLGAYVKGAITGEIVRGAEAEYAEAVGCPGMLPLTMCGPTMEERHAAHRARLETRAVTEGPADADVPHTHAPIVPALFDRSIAPYLGIEMPTVGTGVQSYPVISTSLTAGMRAESADAPETAGAYGVTDAAPRRLTGAFRIRVEDVAKLPNFEGSLRDNLNAVLADEFDKQGVNGDGNDPNLNGLLAQLANPSAPTAGAESYARYQTALSSHVDGLFAVMPGDVRALVGVETLRHMLGEYRADEDATTAYDMATQKYGGVRASRRIDAPASNVQQAIVRRANPAGDRVAVAPVWMGVELGAGQIRDPYTGAGKGEIVVTAVALVGGIVILRPGAFVQDSFRLG